MEPTGFRIGDLALSNVTVFAPLAGFSNLPLRLLAKEAGCALVCSEMISAKGLEQDSGKTLRLMDSTPLEKPLSVQIFGAEPSVMAEAAAIVEARGADIVDINFGCSVKKILKSGSGSALMKQPVLASEILRAVRKAVAIPLTVKIRSGWDNTGDQAERIARIAQDSGVDALTLHPRTAGQGFSGRADWSLIRRIKSLLDIPVIGSGDIVYPEDALRMIRETGCDGIMIGRAAIGSPWIFSQVLALLRNETPPVINARIRFSAMIRYLDASFTYLDDKPAALMMRSRLGWFVKGLRDAGKFRQSIKHIASREEAMEIILAYQAAVSEDPDEVIG
jgi:tRNA-dihydrouridine synthase B